MILHAMHVVRNVVEYLNPEQTPFITADQSLYAILKQCQWQWPNNVAEDKYFVLMGGLHIEMNLMKLLGHWLDGSGWSKALVEAGITTSGKADDAVKGGHVTRLRYFHEVTAASLGVLQRRAYDLYIRPKSCKTRRST